MDDKEFDQLVQACYQGPIEDNLWQTFLQLLQKALDARFATLLLRPPKAGDSGVVLNAHVLSNDVYDEYNERYFSEDPFIDLPIGKAFTSDELVDTKSYKQTEFYKSYLKSVDVAYILGVDLEDENGYSARLRISRGTNDKNFGKQQKQLLERLVPHVTQSIVLYSRIVHAESKAKPYQDAFNQMEIGCVILDNNFEVISKNRAADDLLEEKMGLTLKDEQLIVGSREENKRFRELVESMLSVQSSGGLPDVSAFRIEVPHSVTGLGVVCRAMPPAATPDAGPSVTVFISNPEKPRLNKVTILEQLFGLTLSEAKLALLLANGLSLDEAAEELGITRNTVKSHLSATFSKTGVTRQPGLVQLILRSVASVG